MKFSALFLATIAAGASAAELRSVAQQQQQAERLLGKYDDEGESFDSIVSFFCMLQPYDRDQITNPYPILPSL